LTHLKEESPFSVPHFGQIIVSCSYDVFDASTFFIHRHCFGNTLNGVLCAMTGLPFQHFFYYANPLDVMSTFFFIVFNEAGHLILAGFLKICMDKTSLICSKRQKMAKG